MDVTWAATFISTINTNLVHQDKNDGWNTGSQPSANGRPYFSRNEDSYRCVAIAEVCTLDGLCC